MGLSTFFLGALFDLRIVRLQPLLDLGVLALGCTLHRPLRGEAPALEIIGDRAQRQGDVKCAP